MLYRIVFVEITGIITEKAGFSEVNVSDLNSNKSRPA